MNDHTKFGIFCKNKDNKHESVNENLWKYIPEEEAAS